MKRRTLILIGVPLGLVLGATVIGASVAGERKASSPAQQPKPKLAAVKRTLDEACSSETTYDRLKTRLFDMALDIGDVDPKKLDLLAGSTIVRMEDPILKAKDEELGVTVCSGRFVVELPPAAVEGFGGRRRLVADIEYAAQVAADGSGLVYQLRGAEPITYRLAAFDVEGMPALPPVEAAPKLAEAEPILMPAELVPAAVVTPPVAAAPVKEVLAPAIAAEASAPKKEPARKAEAKPAAAKPKGEAKKIDKAKPVKLAAKSEKAKPVTKKTDKKKVEAKANEAKAKKPKPEVKLAAKAKSKARPAPAAKAKPIVQVAAKAKPAPKKAAAKPVKVAAAKPPPKAVAKVLAKAAAKPAVKVAKASVPAKAAPKPVAVQPQRVSSSNLACGAGRPLTERIMCANPALATKERRMMNVYYSALDNADGRTRRLLQQTAGNFQAYRNNCRTEMCLSGAFDERMAEIRDIMSDMR